MNLKNLPAEFCNCEPATKEEIDEDGVRAVIRGSVKKG